MVIRSYRLKVVRAGQEFEAEGDKAFVLDMMARFSRSTEDVTVTSEKPAGKRDRAKLTPTLPLSGKVLSIREFIQQLALKKHTDITLAFAYYLEKHTGVSEFTPADINTCYYEAKLESSNTSQMIIQNIRRGFFMASKKKEERGKSRYTVTASGETFVESKLAHAQA